VEISGAGVYSSMRFGVRASTASRRVPATEAQGRIHILDGDGGVMPEADEVDIKVNPADLEWDVMRLDRRRRAEREHHPTAPAAATHKPSGSSSVPAGEVAAEEPLDGAEDAAGEAVRDGGHPAEDRARPEPQEPGRRRRAVGKNRTYNFPQDRLTDHRIGLTVHNLPAIMNGDLDDVVTALRHAAPAERLREENGGDVFSPSP